MKMIHADQMTDETRAALTVMLLRTLNSLAGSDKESDQQFAHIAEAIIGLCLSSRVKLSSRQGELLWLAAIDRLEAVDWSLTVSKLGDDIQLQIETETSCDSSEI
jgi:hypothetical protein